MRKILIIDDRPQRAKTLLGDKIIQLENHGGVELDYKLQENIEHLGDYSVVAIHRSLLVEKELLNVYTEYAKKHNLYMIMFSGGTGNVSLVNRNILELPARKFYDTEKLFNFINHVTSTADDINLLEFLYGEQHVIADLLRLQHLFWRYPERKYQKDIDDEVNDLIERISPYIDVDDNTGIEALSAFINKRSEMM